MVLGTETVPSPKWCMLRLLALSSGLRDVPDLLTAKWLMLQVTEDMREEDRGLGLGEVSTNEGRSGLRRGLASWSNRDIE